MTDRSHRSYRELYSGLATHLRALPLSASVADLAASITAYMVGEPAFGEQMVQALGSPDDEYLAGLIRLCDFLKADYDRFVPGLFMAWAMEGK